LPSKYISEIHDSRALNLLLKIGTMCSTEVSMKMHYLPFLIMTMG
jgi:hypothetical protein